MVFRSPPSSEKKWKMESVEIYGNFNCFWLMCLILLQLLTGFDVGKILLSPTPHALTDCDWGGAAPEAIAV
ncbi:MULTISPECIES: hypothetical protein [unclassified Anabaena]|uniref:hypothetical protein n=1 Tax=unclassified Anabaena TaxID=2619674 RepID=UPI000836484B|nr:MULTISPECIES: hypothetical protein [unclassified Anabaena]